MTRATPHKAVYALTSGRGAVGGRPRSSSTPPPPYTVNTLTPTTEGKEAEKRATGEETERVRRGSMKRVKVAPDPDGSDSESIAEPATATATTTTAVDSISKATDRAEQPPASPVSSSPSLPAIQRGLRASRIVPVTDAESAAEVQSTQSPEERRDAPPSAPFINDRRRVYPSEGASNHEIQGTGRGGLGGGGIGDGLRTRIPSRPPPPVTNLDFTSSAPAVSSTSTLPPLELEVAPLPSLPPSPSSPTNGRATVAPDGCSGEKADKADDDDIEGNLPTDGASEDILNNQPKANREGDGGRIPPAAADAAAPAVAAAMAAAAAVVGTKKEAADLERKVSLGRRHAEELRDRLNHTFTPQGIEITAVMICSTELPCRIAEQMSSRTLNASLAEEQRAVKRSESQKVRHEGDVLELRQRWGIDRSLILREGDREVAKVGGNDDETCVCWAGQREIRDDELFQGMGARRRVGSTNISHLLKVQISRTLVYATRFFRYSLTRVLGTSERTSKS